MGSQGMFSFYFKSSFFLLIAIFLNLNVVDDRFVSPIEDLDYQIQSYELEETTRILTVSSQNRQEQELSPEVPEWLVPVFVLEISFVELDLFRFFPDSILFFHFLYLPPPSLA